MMERKRKLTGEDHTSCHSLSSRSTCFEHDVPRSEWTVLEKIERRVTVSFDQDREPSSEPTQNSLESSEQ
ncbi:hypothetical protein GALMADRAFT_401572 [Galerina marginata CBS 339.88]|uniref:Uncharacterized protein n=1 Tax=Galerina marginata (strain CBS 339.88) TaxID=685588 RepID=A0A067TS89_GALM3|nr:hypothetical protein GALMADRAFT_401572 [Galerina marginata CBS 339.88]